MYFQQANIKVVEVVEMQHPAEKRCKSCNTIQKIDQFEKKKRELNYRNICKTCRKHNNSTASRLKRAHVKQFGKPPPYSPCAICRDTPKTLVFDHCHKTEQFRGWLCRSCNCSIAKLGDNVEGLKKALHYLQDFENK